MTGEEIRRIVMNYPFLEKREDGLYVTDKKFGSRKIILLTLGGSYAYGTNVEGSDVDVRGIALRTQEEILLGKDFEQFIDEDTDTVIYSFDKMCKLLAAANPNTIEILGVREEDILYIDPVGKELLEKKEMFLSKRVIQTFAGYANAQLHRLKNRSVRGVDQKEREEHILESIKNASETIKERYKDSSDSIRLYIDEAVNEDMETEIFMDVNMKHYPLRDYKDYWSELNSIVKSYKKIGKRNNSAYNRGKITKHAMHLLRLQMQLIDILEKGEIKTYRPERDFLLRIRNGLFFDGDRPKEEFFEYVEKLEKRINRLEEYTVLPDKPDWDSINHFIQEVNRVIIVKDTKENDSTVIIYPGQNIPKKLSIQDVYAVLEKLADKGILTSVLEVHCPHCDQWTGIRYQSFLEIPEKTVCPKCGEKISDEIFENSYVVYQKK